MAPSHVRFKRKAKLHVPASTGTAKAHERTAPQNLDSVSESCLLCLFAVKLHVHPTHGSHIVPHARGLSRSDPIEDRFPDAPLEALLSSTLFLYCPSVFTTMPTGWRGKAANATERTLHLYSAFTEEGRGRHLGCLHIH